MNNNNYNNFNFQINLHKIIVYSYNFFRSQHAHEVGGEFRWSFCEKTGRGDAKSYEGTNAYVWRCNTCANGKSATMGKGNDGERILASDLGFK